MYKRQGKKLTTFFETFPEGIEDPLPLVIDALSDAVAAGRMRPLNVETVNGEPAFRLRDLGVAVTHKGVRIGGKQAAPPKRRGRSMTEALGDLDGLSFDD